MEPIEVAGTPADSSSVLRCESCQVQATAVLLAVWGKGAALVWTCVILFDIAQREA